MSTARQVARRVSFTIGSPSPKGLVEAEKRSRLSQWTETTARSLTRFAEEYIMEWTLTDARNTKALQKRVDALGEAINYSDVVCFVKPGGLCPFCNLASRVLVAAANGDTFTLHIADLLNEDREALRLMLDVPVLTWPVIYIRGAHLTGGGEAVARLEKSNELLSRIQSAERVQFEPKAVTAVLLPRPRLLHQAGGGKWLGCQTRIYGNVLRMIALFQIALLVPAHELDKRGYTTAAAPLLLLLAIDSLLFTLLGPTPWTPLGSLSTLIVWPRRGTVAPLVPYKVTFGALYFLLNSVSLGCRLAASSSSASMSNVSVVADDTQPALCTLINSDGLVWTMVTNSIMLAVFRF